MLLKGVLKSMAISNFRFRNLLRRRLLGARESVDPHKRRMVGARIGASPQFGNMACRDMVVLVGCQSLTALKDRPN